MQLEIGIIEDVTRRVPLYGAGVSSSPTSRALLFRICQT